MQRFRQEAEAAVRTVSEGEGALSIEEARVSQSVEAEGIRVDALEARDFAVHRMLNDGIQLLVRQKPPKEVVTEVVV